MQVRLAPNCNTLIIEMEGEVISQEERKRLDRQRFIGWETQKKLLNSRVLITPANGPNTELAKNLILAGVNVTIYDSATVTEDDFETNFLVAESDLGRNRAAAVFEKLREMNPSGKNELFEEQLVGRVGELRAEDFRRYTMIATSVADLRVASLWDQLARAINVPYYNLVCCGLYGFVFISLGPQYTYREISKKDGSLAKLWTVPSLSLSQALDWARADKNREFIAAIDMMARAQQQGFSYDPFASGQQALESIAKLEAIVSLGVASAGEKHREFLQAFARTYGVDYCPVYSVLGSVVSQEVIKVVENQSEPGMNWLVFNSEEGYGNIVRLQTQKELITSHTQ